jgi:hypothetical protein
MKILKSIGEFILYVILFFPAMIYFMFKTTSEDREYHSLMNCNGNDKFRN